MDPTTVRQHLRELNERMTQIKAEEEVVRNLIVGYEGWLRLGGMNGEHSASPPPARLRKGPKTGTPPPRSATKGKVSLNSAVLRVVEEGHGQPLRASEILERASAMGARTSSKKPEGVVDLMLYSHRDRGKKPIERVATRTWRWKGA